METPTQIIGDWSSMFYGGSNSTSGVIIGDGNRLLTDGTYNYSYDAVGNLISQVAIDPSTVSGPAEIDYAWDNRDRLTL